MSLSPRFEQALVYACVVHAGQTRKGTAIPYVSHLLAVAALALEYGATETEAIAALLHDAAEDGGGRSRLEDIRARFGEEVAVIVNGCTDTFETPKPAWRERKERYIARLPQESLSVALVSCCDKLHNARSILADLRTHGDALWKRFNGGQQGTQWYYRTLFEAYRQTSLSPHLVDELGRTLDEMEAIAGTG